MAGMTALVSRQVNTVRGPGEALLPLRVIVHQRGNSKNSGSQTHGHKCAAQSYCKGLEKMWKFKKW